MTRIHNKKRVAQLIQWQLQYSRREEHTPYLRKGYYTTFAPTGLHSLDILLVYTTTHVVSRDNLVESVISPL